MPLCALSFAFTTLPNLGGIVFAKSFETVPSEISSPTNVSLAIVFGSRSFDLADLVVKSLTEIPP